MVQSDGGGKQDFAYLVDQKATRTVTVTFTDCRLTISKTAVHFNPSGKLFTTEAAWFGTRYQCQWTSGTEGIAKLPRIVVNTLHGNNVFAYVPAFEIAAQNKLELEFTLGLLAGFAVLLQEVGLAVVTHDFPYSFVGRGIFVFNVEDWINPVLTH